MTDSTSANVDAPAQQPASFWEDLIDIFYQPTNVFRRRRGASAWPPFLFVAVSVGVITFATFNAIEPAVAGGFARALPALMRQNPQMTQEMADKAQHVQEISLRYFSGVVMAMSILVVGLLTWLLGKIFGAVEDFGAAMLIASYAYLPRVLGAILSSAQGLLLDPLKVSSLASLSLGPARFFDPATTSPVLMVLLMRLDVTVLWETVLLAVGLAVLGKISKSQATIFGILIWIVGGLSQLRSAYLLS
jgi:hypothetical protein